MKPLILSLSCLFAAMLFAMPTQEELSKAGPLIQELMRDDLTAMRNGKKTRAHAVDLYRQALASNSLAGLQKVAAEKRIAESESAAVVLAV